MPYNRIIVPVDGSKFSERALDEAIKISELTKGSIYLCTVIGLSNIVPPGSLLGLVREASTRRLQSKMRKSAKDQATQMLETLVKRCKSKGVKAEYKVIFDGYISDEILNYAKRKSADLIVIGSQGLHGLKKIKILGSVSRKVSELASCPVLIVR